MFKQLVQRFLPYTRSVWPVVLERMVRTPQPAAPAVRIVFTFLSRTGVNVDGKLTFFEFFPNFLAQLRREGFETRVVFSQTALETAIGRTNDVILVNVFGEDHASIDVEALKRPESQAAAVFNRAEIGPLLSDKLAYHNSVAERGVGVPDLVHEGGFVRERLGTMRPTAFGEEAADAAGDESATIRTRFVDTKLAFEGAEYFTTVRLLCIDDVVLHAYTRARPVEDGNASVHAKDTPLDPALVEFLHASLVMPKMDEYTAIASALHGLLGHGFFVHDLLVEAGTGDVMVCESGIKFDDMAFWKHIAKIAEKAPSHAPILPVDAFARRSAEIFADRCRALLSH